MQNEKIRKYGNVGLSGAAARTGNLKEKQTENNIKVYKKGVHKRRTRHGET